MVTRGRWVYRSPFGDVEIQLGPGSTDASARARAERTLGWLAYDFKYGDPGARRIGLEIYAALMARPGHHGPPSAGAGVGYGGAEAMAEEILRAARRGLIGARTREPHVPIVVPATPDDPALGPESAADEQPTWFSLKVLDEVGAAIDGVDVAFTIGGSRQVVTTDGNGVARLDGITTGSFASAALASLPAVQAKLKPRWTMPRDPAIPAGDGVIVRDVDDGTQPLGLQGEVPGTLVLEPYFRCNEIAGAHFAFGRSFVRSSAFDVLGPIAEVLCGDSGRKGMIFGHTDLAGGEALNKELSERRARAVFALLTQDADGWEALYSGSDDGPNWQEKWDLEEAQHMLNAVGCTDDAGESLAEDGVRGPKTIQAIHNFQAGNYPDCPAEQTPLSQSETLGAAGRKQLFLAYAKRVSRKPVDAGRIGQINGNGFMGCGEYNPLSLTVRDEESRRTVVFLYDPAAEPQGLPCQLRSISPCQGQCGPLPTQPDPDGKPPYRCAVYQRVAKKCPCQPGPDLSHDLTVRIPYTVADANQLPHVFTLDSDDATISQTRSLASDVRAADDGRAEFYFSSLPEFHAYTLKCADGQNNYSLFENIPYDKLGQAMGDALTTGLPGAAALDDDDDDDQADASASQDPQADSEAAGNVADVETA